MLLGRDEETWLDSAVSLVSDCDEDLLSVQGDFFTLTRKSSSHVDIAQGTP
jgi:hypothetical protein